MQYLQMAETYLIDISSNSRKMSYLKAPFAIIVVLRNDSYWLLCVSNWSRVSIVSNDWQISRDALGYISIGIV